MISVWKYINYSHDFSIVSFFGFIKWVSVTIFGESTLETVAELNKVTVKVKITLEQATKAQRGSRV